MELVKEVANKGPESQQNIAIRADEKSYSYLQLISSARRISNLLSKLGLKTVSWKWRINYESLKLHEACFHLYQAVWAKWKLGWWFKKNFLE